MANKKNFTPLEAPTQAEKKKTQTGTRTTRPSFFGRTAERIFGLMKKKKGDATVDVDLISSDDTATEDKTGQPARIAFIIEKNMENFLHELTLGGLKKLKSDWAEISFYQPPNISSTLYDFNMAKNFPGGYPCLDATRVSLTFNVPPDTDYFHANWVQTKFCNLGLRLILTQAPQDSTVNDFYRAIYQEKIRSVVMLCEKYEKNQRVCDQYWPLIVGSSRVYGPLRVQYIGNVTPERETAYIKQHLVISCRSEKAHDCYIYVSKRWPEGGAPESIRAMLRTLRAVVDEGQTVMVHGAAGVGRAGTFAAIMIARKLLLEGKSLTIQTISLIVREIREQRMGCVNTELLYITIYRAICDYIRAKGVKTELCKQLIGHLDSYKKDYIAAGNQPIEVKSGPFEIKGGAMKLSVEARTFPSPTQPVQNSLTPTNLASTPMTNNAGGFAAQPEPKGDDQYVVLNVLNALPAPPPPK